jgi:hypothetical protein
MSPLPASAARKLLALYAKLSKSKLPPLVVAAASPNFCFIGQHLREGRYQTFTLKHEKGTSTSRVMVLDF